MPDLDYIKPSLHDLAVPVKDVKPDPANARKHSDKNIELIRRSLDSFRQQTPIVIDADGICRKGNATLEAAKVLGWTHIAATRSALKGTEAVAYGIADNRTGDPQVGSEWDEPVLADLLEGLRTDDDFDHLLTGFGEEDIDELLASVAGPPEVEEDEVPEVPADPITKPGDLWTLGKHRVLCGDCTKPEDADALFDGERVGLCFTSPPYADQRTYHGCELSPHKLAEFLPNAQRHCDHAVVNLGISQKKGRVVRYWDTYIEAAEACGWGLLSWNVWHKLDGLSVGAQTRMFATNHEWLLVFGEKPIELDLTFSNKTKGIAKTRNRSADGKQTELKSYPRRDYGKLRSVVGTPSARHANDHPAPFPVQLPAEHIKAFNSDVYDPFLGSGTTLIAAEQLGRTCYGLEISPAYCDVIVKRWENLTGKKAKVKHGVGSMANAPAEAPK